MPFEFQTYDNSSATNTIAALMRAPSEAQARALLVGADARAQAAVAGGNAWAGAANSIGNIVRGIPGQLQQARQAQQTSEFNAARIKGLGVENESNQLTLEQQQRAARNKEVADAALTHLGEGGSLDDITKGLSPDQRKLVQDYYDRDQSALEQRKALAQQRLVSAAKLLSAMDPSSDQFSVTAHMITKRIRQDDPKTADFFDQFPPESMQFQAAVRHYATLGETPLVVDGRAYVGKDANGNLIPATPEKRDFHSFKPDDTVVMTGGSMYPTPATTMPTAQPSQAAPQPSQAAPQPPQAAPNTAGALMQPPAPPVAPQAPQAAPQGAVAPPVLPPGAQLVQQGRPQTSFQSVPRLVTPPGQPPRVQMVGFDSKTNTYAQDGGAPFPPGTKFDRAPLQASPDSGVNFTPGGLATAATIARVTGKLPSRSSQQSTAILNEVAKQNAALGDSPAQMLQAQASFKADQGALDAVVKLAASTSGFESKALKQIELIQKLSPTVKRTSWPVINEGLLAFKANVAGDSQTQQLFNALSTFTAEYAKIMEGSTGSAAGSSDAARRAAERLVNASMNEKTLQDTLKLMKYEMHLTTQGWGAVRASIMDNMQGYGAGRLPGQSPDPDLDADGNPVP